MPAQLEAQTEATEARKEKADKVDYKMVTFSLAGKEYGIDIMNVKEIAKAGRFTYVPNAAPFVRGVYNLRGEIISVISSGNDLFEAYFLFRQASKRRRAVAVEPVTCSPNNVRR